MEIWIILAAVALVAILKSIRIKRHQKFLGMGKKKNHPTRDGQR